MSEPRTWLTIEGKRYDLQSAMRQAAIRDLIDLKRATNVGGSSGVSIKTIAETLTAFGEKLAAADDAQSAMLDVFDDVDTLEVFAALVFLCKRKAGEDVSFFDASGYSLADVGMDAEDGEAEADPKDL